MQERQLVRTNPASPQTRCGLQVQAGVRAHFSNFPAALTPRAALRDIPTSRSQTTWPACQLVWFGLHQPSLSHARTSTSCDGPGCTQGRALLGFLHCCLSVLLCGSADKFLSHNL